MSLLTAPERDEPASLQATGVVICKAEAILREGLAGEKAESAG
ncbi:MAG: hypothetical protein ACKOPS_19910 [Cyanobium sp.]